MLTKCMAPYVFSPTKPACVPIPTASVNACDTVKLLPIEERQHYKNLIDTISTDVQRARRHSGLSEFVKHITLVHKFVSQGNTNDPLRGIVCGVEFGRGFILVNTDRLKKILYRSKSCMNGCFQRLGYDVMRPSNDLVCLFTRLLPNVNPEFFAIRQWCVRLVTEQCTLCFLTNMPDSIAANFEVHRIPTQRSTVNTAATTIGILDASPPPLLPAQQQQQQQILQQQQVNTLQQIQLQVNTQQQQQQQIINAVGNDNINENIEDTSSEDAEQMANNLMNFPLVRITPNGNGRSPYSFMYDIRSLLNR